MFLPKVIILFVLSIVILKVELTSQYAPGSSCGLNIQDNETLSKRLPLCHLRTEV